MTIRKVESEKQGKDHQIQSQQAEMALQDEVLFILARGQEVYNKLVIIFL